MKDNINIWMMVGIVVVVAIVTSLVTTSFTGKAILSNTADSFRPMNVKSSNWLQAIFKGTVSAGGIGLNSSDNKQFELQSVQAGGIPGTSKSGFIIYDRNANQYRQVITSDGNVGIGTTNPQAKLEVHGDIRASKLILNSTDWQWGDTGISLRSYIPPKFLNVDIGPESIVMRDSRNRTEIVAGSIAINSPDGNPWRCSVNNSGSWKCT